MLKRLAIMSMALLLLFSCAEKSEDAKIDAKVEIASAEKLQNEEVKEKRALSPDDFAAWERMGDYQITTDGQWVRYNIEPNRGDITLMLHEVETGIKHTFERGSKAAFAPGNEFLAFKRGPRFDTKRQATLDKVKKDKMPKDTLCIYIYEQDTLLTIPRIKNFKMSKEGTNWLTILHEKPLPPEKKDKDADTTSVVDSLKADSLLADTSAVDSSKVKKEKKKTKKKVRESGTPLWVYDPLNQDTTIIEYVTSYTTSKDGDKVVALTKLKTDSVRISIINAEKGSVETILETYGTAKSFSFDDKGEQLAFLFSDDTTDQKVYDVYYWKTGRNKAKCYLDENVRGMKDGWGISSIRMPRFSEDGKRLMFGTAPLPVEEPEDTLLKEEKAVLDVWSWNDPLLQTQQKKELAREKKRNYVAYVNIGNKRIIQLASEEVPTVKTSRKFDEKLTLGESNLPYRKLISWESIDYYDYYLVDIKTGKKELVLRKKSFDPQLSPEQKYLLWYDHEDLNWYTMDTRSKEVVCLTKDLDVAFYNEDDDHPWQPGPHGYSGWGKGDSCVFIYDKYDIWKFDLAGDDAPKNVTVGDGRKNKDIYRYMKLDADLKHIPSESVKLTVFNEKTKKSGFAEVDLYKGAVPEKLLYTDNKYDPVKKAKEANVGIWRRGTYREYPDVYISDLNFEKIEQLSALNPQQSQFRWASVELVEWKNSDGVELQGMLYIPDDLDKSKKHPMVIYYYEKYSDYLHQYFSPTPSYSTINKSFYPSNGYILFIPDIVYKTGHPGRSGLDCVMTGVDMLLEKYDFINGKKIGIQGQSWGGYQTAYFVTQTDRFAAAMAGAPVSNMTSAFGGIRWYTGMSRMMQYEDGQSRIGGTIWDSFDLYYENSPVFFADQIKTPLLMMHNDEDGAVPWTQGIEMMVAMRRLQKPAWMLVYNKTNHNMGRTQWGNRMDLSIRMKQFFDHYLMDKPMPRWMKEGISAQEKGIDMKYELIEE